MMGPDSAKVIQMQVGVDNGGDGLVGVFAQFCYGHCRGAREPATVDHNNAVVTLDEPMVGVANEFSSEHPVTEFSQQGFLL